MTEDKSISWGDVIPTIDMPEDMRRAVLAQIEFWNELRERQVRETQFALRKEDKP